MSEIGPKYVTVDDAMREAFNLCLGVVVVHLSDHNSVMVAQVDYYIRAEQSINGKENIETIHKVSMI